ncbi:hypothetical protein SAMN05216184_101324 [Georgenia satyanarayanai]|uniref:Uncharacterized protein n=1 Tax=Georgenia satyanarayanai TaxID=860221 RepID=A0A2Y9BV30_9MICO|nr:hypothetical protein [Georgenia satyanarayanai]PYG01859.1 hypothetical protein A8987_101324 [Georgenia satyanarayanai]SSA36662.1 hypothetical protein SAMN05216184_101324 [Georgenia satyanarayanai]
MDAETVVDGDDGACTVSPQRVVRAMGYSTGSRATYLPGRENRATCDSFDTPS